MWYLNLSNNTRITCLPEQVGDLPNLQSLLLSGCHNLSSLPASIVKLTNLRHLDISDTWALNKMPLGLGARGWDKWPTISGGKGNMFPFLHEISMINCGKLDEVAIEPIPSLQGLNVQGCSEARIVILTIKNIRGLTQLTEEVFEHLKKVEHLSFSECDELTHLWESEAWTCKNLLNLQSLKVYMCKNLVSLGEEVVQSVTEVNISSCESLESYNCPSSIKKLEISNCPSLTSLSTPKMDGLPSTLKFLHIQDCDNVNNFLPSIEYLHIYGRLKKPISETGMQNFPTSLVTLVLYGGGDSGLVTFTKAEEEDTSTPSFVLPSSLTSLYLHGFKELESPSEGLQHLTCLQHLHIYNCPNLRDLPETLLPSLSSLRVDSNCSHELRKKCTRSRKGKYWPIISQIPNLQIE
ncbi:hypothetical protein E3N88_31892 [Mikania micrantha]|uniref:Disease resistance protein At4g27190-like leucine-rich repeats domain-containing protein n=1 Tax=Mikania micrantha TaxID=192012 RepID=A0A5N6M7M3_9ASTR|nr:hypothetical protein E3N88_31892 [Mikania micrantha]